MKNSIQHLKLFLTGILATGFVLFAINSFAGDDKPKGKPWPCPEKNAAMKNPAKADATTLATGKELYTRNCKSCHGEKGKGDGPKAEKIEISCGDFTGADFAKQSDGELFWKTTEGRKPMPSYKEKLTDDERWIVIHYMRSLGKGK
ncbi:MAG: cytochrome c [Bacteroidetes bacterium]|nr:cytochrome c [Bacteroidota bacterium]